MDIVTRSGSADQPTVVAVRGELDALTATSLRTLLSTTIDGGRADVVLDATELTFIDSTGLGVLVIALKRTRARGGSLALVGITGPVLRTFTLTGLHRVFRLYDDVESAVADHQRSQAPTEA